MNTINKNKLKIRIIIVLCIILGTFKAREYYILKDSFVFSKDDIVQVWTSNKDVFSYNYNCHVSEADINHLSELLTNSKLEKSSIKEAPIDRVKMFLLLDGNIRENKDGSISVYNKRLIHLSKINNEEVYAILEINKLRDDNSFVKQIAQKYYTINSKELVELIDNIDK